ncbi:group I intron-associated PD-(D/E)XK endonuclease [Paracoccus aestuarii]|uniref:group I intron-associated PD-(D/E)XK endonuclease n=1 Tax=Paracoccus aestuarii TaxID=453842 RepID=UPI0011C4A317|nr:group I intron-associated PD-(D/E)XK endonuclease [Paracoccus aestuarii]WCQ98631.1 hypothetical protein JHW48_12135 [Paracoccus aestuarii]
MIVQLPLPGLNHGPQREATEAASLASYPDVDPRILCLRAKALGHAGELLVLSKLTRLGETVFQAGDGLPYDVLMPRLEMTVRVQVKTTTSPQNGFYRFEMRKGYRNNPQGTRLYRPEDYDIAALVILPLDLVIFTARKLASHRIALHQIAAFQVAPRQSLHAAFSALGLSHEACAFTPAH